MKLINPTDDELNAAFAEHVARWKRHEPLRGEKRKVVCRLSESNYDPFRPQRGDIIVVWTDGRLGGTYPQWTTSADAVLPWLEKCKDRGWWVKIKDHTNGIECGRRDWLVIISDYDDCCDPYAGEPGYAEPGKPLMYREGASPVFPKAAVLALLRAHGVEVEFVK
jgi:hypothetical protein